MNILKRRTVEVCTNKYPEAKESLLAWYEEVKKENWKSPIDVKKKYPKASIVGSDRVVFNITGNKYRLIVKVRYRSGHIYITFFGTHQEYDKVNAETVQIFKNPI